MTVYRLSSDDQKHYSEFVAAHESGSFLQSWSWGDFQTQLNREAVRYGIFADMDQGKTKMIAAAQLFNTKIPRLPGFYLYAPYGPLISTGLNPTTTADVSNKLIEKIEDEFPKAWFIRFEPKDTLPIDGKPSLHIQPGSTLLTDLTASETDLLSAMHQKTRYNIRVASKHGVVVSSGSASTFPKTDQTAAVNLLTGTSKRQGYKSHSKAYYKQLLDFFAQENGDCQARLYTAKYNGQVIATAIMIDHSATQTYLFGGSDNSQRALMAPYALHWQAIQDAQRVGLKQYDWWGTETASGATPGFVQFKLRWGGTQKFYAGSRDIVLNSPWYHAYNALRKVNRFF